MQQMRFDRHQIKGYQVAYVNSTTQHKRNVCLHRKRKSIFCDFQWMRFLLIYVDAVISEQIILFRDVELKLQYQEEYLELVEYQDNPMYLE